MILKLITDHKEKIIQFIVLIIIYLVLYKLYIPRVNAFGCFDDCFNFMGGYFLLKGKSIFIDFFYNHQPIAAYISLFIQYITSPDSIYELVLRHRQFILLLGLISYILLTIRFGGKVIIFAIIFEFSKFYLFGDRFLAENIIIYPIIYMIGLILLKFDKQKISDLDLVICSFITWFIVFSREPYIPLAIFLFIVILYPKKLKEFKKTPVVLFLTLSITSVLLFNIKEYFYNLITINFQVVIPNEIKGQLYGGLETIFLYPIFVFTDASHNLFKNLLIAINALFIFYFLKLLINRKYLFAFIIFLILGLANLKPNAPGKLFYESFHMVIWYGSITFTTIFLIFLKIKHNKVNYLSILLLILVFISFVSTKNYFANEKINTHEEFIAQYGTILQDAEVIKVISKPSNTLFLDGDNELIYFQSQRMSSYKYTWYTSVMPFMKKYSDARIDMFKKDSPDIYREYGSCPKKNKVINLSLPLFIEKEYVNLIADGKKSCIYVKKSMLLNISKKQWDEAKKLLYELPSNQL